MKLVVNGDARAIEGVTTVSHLVAALDLPARLILIEHNGTALRREEWETQLLHENDRIEFIRVVAGG